MVTFLLSTLVCASSCVCLKNSGQNRQSHTGCICLIFLHCVFSYVFSTNLDQSMQSHTGCICLAFLHCVFSYVSSKNLDQSMQSHTGCICLILCHCFYLFQVFSHWYWLNFGHYFQDFFPLPQNFDVKVCSSLNSN